MPNNAPSPSRAAPPAQALRDAPDEQIAALAAQGDPTAFEQIMRRHNRLLFRTARSILAGDAEAVSTITTLHEAAAPQPTVSE